MREGVELPPPVRPWVTVVAALILALGVLMFAYLLLFDDYQGEETDWPLGVAALLFVVVGTLVVVRTGGNRVGWVLSATGLTLLGSGMVGIGADHGSLVAEAVGGALWLSWFFLVGLLMYWFPTGRPVSPRWRWIAWMGALGEVFSLSYVVSEQLCVESGGGTCSTWVDNPIGITGVPNPEYGPLSGVTLLFVILFALLAAASQVVRYVRARGVERLQIKWFAFAVIGAISLIIVQSALRDVVPLPAVVWDLVFALSVVAFPVAIGASVMRYRLYEIDRIMSRTVSYTLVVGFLGLVFVGTVTGLTTLLETQSDLVVAGSTLAVAALFNPVRKRVQGVVDRRFNRSRYDAERVMTRFAAALRDEVDPDAVVDGWMSVVAATMEPSTAAVWVRDR
jgi:hypothetical protein